MCYFQVCSLLRGVESFGAAHQMEIAPDTVSIGDLPQPSLPPEQVAAPSQVSVGGQTLTQLPSYLIVDTITGGIVKTSHLQVVTAYNRIYSWLIQNMSPAGAYPRIYSWPSQNLSHVGAYNRI